MRASVAASLLLLSGVLLAHPDGPKSGWQAAAFGFGAGLSAYVAVLLIVAEARAERKRGRK